MADAFQNILGQPDARNLLRASVVSDRVTHAYLFVGPAGSNKTQAAYALAAAIVCPKGAKGPRGGACGDCENCRKVGKRTHPDIHYHAPEGASGYLIGQIREIVSDISLAPIQASRKVYIIDRADLLGHSASNALLKTLEEPPDDVVLILMARTRDSILPTIASRCQIIPFRHIPPSEAAGIISQNTGADAESSRIALEAANGSITNAIAFLAPSNNDRPMIRTELLRGLCRISGMDEWDILKLAKWTVDAYSGKNGPAGMLRDELEQRLAEEQEFLSKSAIKRIEERNRRRLSKETTALLFEALAIISSWLRDIAVAAGGAPELIINSDFRDKIESDSVGASLPGISMALASVDEARSALDYNVSPETCFDNVFFKIKEAFE